MRLALAMTTVLALAAQTPTGGRLYEEHCALCHGAHGYDGVFANLAMPKLPRAPDDAAMFKIIKAGIDGTDMSPAYGVTDDEVRQIITHVRSLGRAGVQIVSGNRARGEQIYGAKGNCATCHMVNGRGGRQGPDLSDIGARRSASHLRQSLLDPEAALPFGFLLVDLVGRDGGKISGVRLNEDGFSIQVRDLDDRLHSFWKADLADVRKQWGKTSMPSYRALLTASELDDLVAYLVSLRGGL